MKTKNIPLVAIVGRPNVGKSTLFNALLAHRRSVIEDVDGVSRDRNYGMVTRFGSPFTVVDTGGLFGDGDGEIFHKMISQTKIAIDEADAVVVLFDGIGGLNPIDEDLVQLIRESRKPVIWVVNKCEKPSVEEGAAEFFGLGIDDYLCISSAHKKGVKELAEKIYEVLKLDPEADKVTENSCSDPEDTIRVAVLGRPNVGKSTLINKLLGEDRLITSPIAGTTRDSIDIPVKREGQDYILIDTAGLRKKARVDDGTIERFSNLRSLRALARCDVAILLLDATEGLPTDQDSKIAGLAHERGRSLVVVVNKWDAVEKDHKTAKAYKDAVIGILGFAKYAPIVFVSALTGRRCPAILDEVKKAYDQARVRIPTSPLTKVIETAFKRKPPPVHRAEPLKFFFATQVDVAPPTIVLFLNYPRKLHFSYQRYLKNELRKQYPFVGTDIRFVLRKKGAKPDEQATV